MPRALSFLCCLVLALSPLAAAAQEVEKKATPAPTEAAKSSPVKPAEPEAGAKAEASKAENSKAEASKTEASKAATTPREAKPAAPLSDAEINKLANKFKVVPEQPPETLVIYLTALVVIFGLLVLVLMTILIIRDKDPGQILRLFTVPLVVVAAIFLIVTGYSQDQIAPVIGLFGTLVGYILGANAGQGKTPPAPARAKETVESDPGK